MTYYQKKAYEIRDLALAHPWDDDARRALEEALRGIAKDQRHACADSLREGEQFSLSKFRTVMSSARIAVMKAGIEE